MASRSIERYKIITIILKYDRLLNRSAIVICRAVSDVHAVVGDFN